MTTTWKRPERPQTSDELDKSMTEELDDLGLLEHGMSFEDKRDLLNVVRISQQSAQVEEEERKTKGLSPSPQQSYANSVASEKENEMMSTSQVRETIHAGEQGEITQDILSNLSMAVSDCNVQEGPSLQSNEYTVPSLEYVRDVCPSTSVNESQRMQNSPKPSMPSQSKDSEVGGVSGEFGSIPNGCENEEGELEADQENFDNSIFPLRSKDDANGLKRKKEDKEKNFDVFSHCDDVEEHNFLRRNMNKNQERIPFYFVPEGMTRKKYISYFKCYVSQYYEKLAVIQRNSLEHLEWGAPITMNSSSFRSNSDAQGDSSKRYNFRERYTKPKFIDYASENSEDAEEEESNDEDMFLPRNKKFSGIKLSAKRKNNSANDTMSTKKEKKECFTLNKKSQEDADAMGDELHGEHGQGDGMDHLGSKGKGAMSRKRARKFRGKQLRLQMETQSEVPEDISEMLPAIEPDCVIAEGVAAVSSIPPLLDRHQPSPLSVKQRRLQMQGGCSPRHNRRKSEPRKNPDVVLLDEEEKSPWKEIENVPCPICYEHFPVTFIEEHASECNRYCPDNTSSVRT